MQCGCQLTGLSTSKVTGAALGPGVLTYTGLAVSVVVVLCYSLPLLSLLRLPICKKHQQCSFATETYKCMRDCMQAVCANAASTRCILRAKQTPCVQI